LALATPYLRLHLLAALQYEEGLLARELWNWKPLTAMESDPEYPPPRP